MTTTIQAYSLLFASKTGQNQSSQKTAGSEDFAAMLNMVDVNQKSDEAKKEVANSTHFLSSIQQFMAGIDSSLFGINASNETGSLNAASANGSISVDELLNQGGPLPEFLDRIGARYGLDDAHKQALRNIAIQFKDTTGSQAEVQQMAAALQSAGIGISI